MGDLCSRSLVSVAGRGGCILICRFWSIWILFFTGPRPDRIVMDANTNWTSAIVAVLAKKN